MKLTYMAHPVAGDAPANLARAKLWLKWLTESREEPSAVIAPWIIACEIWDDANPEERTQGLERCKAAIERCDEIYLVGGRVSNGMEIERRHAMRHGLTVIDITAMGKYPPGYELWERLEALPAPDLAQTEGRENNREAHEIAFGRYVQSIKPNGMCWRESDDRRSVCLRLDGHPGRCGGDMHQPGAYEQVASDDPPAIRASEPPGCPDIPGINGDESHPPDPDVDEEKPKPTKACEDCSGLGFFYYTPCPRGCAMAIEAQPLAQRLVQVDGQA